jgi:hypothetical protein
MCRALTHQPLAPDEPLSVRTHGTAEGDPRNPHASEEGHGEQEPLSVVLAHHKTSALFGRGLTMRAFQRALTGALEVKMMVRRRIGMGVFSHSRLSTSSFA